MRGKRRLVFVIPGLGRGGAQAHMIRDANGLVRAGYEVSVIVINADGTMASELSPSIEVHLIGGRTSSLRTLMVFLKTLRELSPDLVIGWSVYANLIVGLAQTFGAARKTLLVENNFPPLSYGMMSWPIRMTVRGLAKLAYAQASTIAANSAGTLEYLKRWIGSKHRFARIRNPVDIDRFQALSQQRLPDNALPFDGATLMMAGRMWRYQKGVDVLLLAARRLLDSPHPWRLWMLGDGGDLEELKKMSTELELEGRVSWFGMQENPFPFYRHADVVVLPSRFEGYPNTALEAMAIGKAVVCADCQTGPRELTSDGKYGVLVPVGDDAALADALAQLIADRGRCANLGASAAAHIARIHDEQRVFGELIDVIEQAAG